MFEGFTLEYVDVGEVTLRARHGGQGPPVVLLHGHPRTHTTWHRVAPLLAGSFSVVCPDLPGYGHSTLPPDAPQHGQSSKRAMAGDVVSLMRHLGHEQFAVGARSSHSAPQWIIHTSSPLAEDEARIAVEPERVLLALTRHGRVCSLWEERGVMGSDVFAAIVREQGIGDELVLGRVPRSLATDEALLRAVEVVAARGSRRRRGSQYTASGRLARDSDGVVWSP